MTNVTDQKVATPQPRGEGFVRVVLDVTLAQLAEVGFARLSIPAISELAGVNKTSIYRRWPGKAELVRDALEAAMSHADNPTDTGALQSDLVALARTVAQFMHSPVGTAVIRIMLAEGGNPEVRALANMAYRASNQQGPWEVNARATKRGELAEQVDPSTMLFTIAGAIMHRVFVEQREATDEFLEQVVNLVLFGATVKR